MKACLLLLASCLTIACQNHATIEIPKPLPQDPLVKVYFNHNQAQNYTEPYRKITRSGDNLEAIMLEAIQSARSSIDIAVQEFRLPHLATALAQKSKTGVKVRLIIENQYNQPISETRLETLAPRERDRYQEYFALTDSNSDGKLSQTEINERDALVILKNHQIPLIDDTADGSQGTGLMHHKFIVIDGKIIIITSANFTSSDIHGDITRPNTRGNANNLLKIESNAIAQIFTEEFNIMWGGGPGRQLNSKFGIKKPSRPAKYIALDNSKITIKFSPNSSRDNWQTTTNGIIGNTLNKSNKSINLALYVFSEQSLANILENRHQADVNIKALIDPEFIFRSYSEGLDMLGVALNEDCRYEKGNKPWLKPINSVGIPQIPKGDKLHHKFGIIDRHTIIAGSHNWSASANYQNDETLIIIQNPIVTAHYLREFERLYRNSILGLSPFVRQKIQENAQKCPTPLTTPSAINSPSLVNINTASKTELESLPGIGEKMAENIIEARQETPFTALEDLNRVPGIGDSKIKQLQGKVTW